VLATIKMPSNTYVRVRQKSLPKAISNLGSSIAQTVDPRWPDAAIKMNEEEYKPTPTSDWPLGE
jgi:hypothetical protein